ncbi:MAG: FHA domain-containing protein [Acidobacteriota bacterium]
MNQSVDESWSCDAADEQGWVRFEHLQTTAARGGPEGFFEAFPRPALLCVFGGDDGSDVVDANESGIQLLTVSVKSTGVLRYLSRVAFVAKRPGNPYAHLISIGRSATNDITLAVDSVSKVHGYIARAASDDGSAVYRFTDHGSTNGSKLNGEDLEPSREIRLRDRDVLQIGLEVHLQYLEPESLYRRVTKS